MFIIVEAVRMPGESNFQHIMISSSSFSARGGYLEDL